MALEKHVHGLRSLLVISDHVIDPIGFSHVRAMKPGKSLRLVNKGDAASCRKSEPHLEVARVREFWAVSPNLLLN
jgi:hypothetical protein